MTVGRQLTGRVYRATHEVTEADLGRFADAIGADHDVIAPPTYPVVVAMGAMDAMLADAGQGIAPVHAAQGFRYQRPIRAGDRLVATTNVDRARPMPEGTYLALRTEIGTEKGESVCTAHSTLFAVPLPAGAGIWASSAVPRPPSAARLEWTPGTPLRLTRDDLLRYAVAAGDPNPVHWDDAAAEAAGLPGVIAHGMLTMALAGRAVTSLAGDPGALAEFAVRFSEPLVVPEGEGALLDVSATISEEGDVRLSASCGGLPVLGRTEAVLRIRRAVPR